jgi:hypothetical protein
MIPLAISVVSYVIIVGVFAAVTICVVLSEKLALI